MRLIELTLSAFGPYKVKQTINFTEINDRKLFLITGPTGAGKTSIFDAISFALFGSSNGSNRDGDSLRSDFASLDDETYVSLTFEIKGNIYKVWRSPKQEKRRAKGMGTTLKQAEAVLEVRNGKTYTGCNEVTNQIQEILGINYPQFKQIVMLPQGEFRKLLEAESKDREVIFRKIFKTEAYQNIQETLKTKAGLLANEIGEGYNLLDNNLLHINCDETSELADLLKAGNKNYELIISLIEEKNKNDELSLEKIKLLIENKEKDIFHLTQECEKAQNINMKFAKFNELKNKQEELLNVKENIELMEIKLKKANFALVLKQIEEQINRNKIYLDEINKSIENDCNLEKNSQNLIDELNNELSKLQGDYDHIIKQNEKLGLLKDQLVKYDAYEEKQKELQIIETQISAMLQDINNKESKITELKQQLENLQEKLNSYQNLNENLKELKSRQEMMQSKEKQDKLILSILDELVNSEEEKRKLDELYLIKDNEYKKSKSLYEEKLDKYLLGQAGILASNLKENMPCPVCGSSIHPHKAQIPKDVPTNEELEVLKTDLSVKETGKNDVYSKVYSLKMAIDDKKNIYRQMTEQEFTDFNLHDEINKMSKAIDDDKSDLEKIKADIEKLENELKIKNKFEVDLQNKTKELNDEEMLLLDINKAYSDLNNKYQLEKGGIKHYQDTLLKSYPHKSELIFEIKSLEEAIDSIKNQYQGIKQRLDEEKNNLLILQTNIGNHKQKKAECMNEIETDLLNYQNKLKEFDFRDEEEYKASLFNIAELEELKVRVREYYDELSFVDKSLKELTVELEDLTPMDIKYIQDKLNEEKEKWENLRNEEKNYHLALQNNLKIFREASILYNKIRNRIKEYEVISDLAKAANGDNPQKMTFERYVLAAYFDEIIAYANIRLGEMSSNRYYLCRKEEKGKGRAQQGLDLEVIDNYTGKNRPVNTLSGGEAFIASLALALGLADVVQSYSGGIQLDTIFIDEGFGSLDPESLDQAINTLLKIQEKGRLVGIISHVQELKERIDVKLEITPSKSGSTAKFIY